MRSAFTALFAMLFAVAIIWLLLALGCSLCRPALARDDGRYAQNPLKPWFDSLKSQRGFCCSDADGEETEYEIRGNAYWVPVNGVWREVPDDAVIKEPNEFGRSMLWLRVDREIQCFIPGAGL